MIWEPSSRINQYTGEPNWYVWIGIAQLVVFMRANGWNYTVRVPIKGGRWLQLSSDSQGYLRSMTEAKDAAYWSMVDLLAWVGDHADPTPRKPDGEGIHEVLDSLGIRDAYYRHKPDWIPPTHRS